MTTTLIAHSRIAVLTLAAFFAAAPAHAQSCEDLIDRYRQECLAQYAYLREPGQNNVVAARVHDCIMAKMKTGMEASEHVKANAPRPGGEGLKLFEFTPWLDHPRRGAAEAKGVLYFVGGYTLDRIQNEFQLGPYIFKSLTEDGWDIIFAKMPESERHPPIAIATLGAAARTMERRAHELRAEGYRRVMVGGHSWGGWVALVAASDHIDADAILSSVPTTFGPRISSITHEPNPNFSLNLSEFPAAIGKVAMPTILITPDDSVWDPDPAAHGEMRGSISPRPRCPTSFWSNRLAFTATSPVGCRSSTMLMAIASVASCCAARAGRARHHRSAIVISV